MEAPHRCSGAGVHTTPPSPGQPRSVQERAETIKRGLAGLHQHGTARSRYLIPAGMYWGHRGL